MGEEMARKKKEEIEELEKQETEDKSNMKGDICPHCGQSVGSYPYVMFEPVFGWLECAVCGVVFSPTSIRRMKIKESQKKVQPVSSLVLAKG